MDRQPLLETSTEKQSTAGRCGKCLQVLRRQLLIVCLVLALVLGASVGAALRSLDPPLSSRQIIYLRFPGDLLMNMLSFLIVPLIASSLVSGLASLDTQSSGKIGLRAVVYYLMTTLAAVVLGIILCVSIQPGTRGGEPEVTPEDDVTVVNTADTFLDLIRQCFPDNIVEMCFRKTVTEQVLRPNGTNVSMTTVQNDTGGETVPSVYDPVPVKTDGVNVLGLVVFSILLGVVTGHLGDRGRPILIAAQAVCDATMCLVQLVIWYSPVGILCLIAAKLVEIEDLARTFQQLSFYFLTVTAGLLVHAGATLPLIYLAVVRKNPYRYLLGVLEPLVTALATSSSSATMPVTMRCLEVNNHVDPRVVKFVIPVGATVNMDGTALYEAVAAIFIGQMRGFHMDIGRIVTISITATAAAIGAAGVPQAGLVTMVIVLSAVGFPVDDVALILAVDWLLDRIRTAVNVLGDAFGAGIVHHLSKAELRILDHQNIALPEDDVIITVEHEPRESTSLLQDDELKNKYSATKCHDKKFVDVNTFISTKL
ncbi:EAA3-like protein [Mya arenaria]|uniref:Amino acid transporter n=1 Tax=Mya arenaria TaxID=6604 RepID=A0ABY7FP67_MYAAR|nr:excitatory amino acid transporter 3-like [Mya arenaria]WAR22812.1 EAA3-like protein [Mya arenaria]